MCAVGARARKMEKSAASWSYVSTSRGRAGGDRAVRVAAHREMSSADVAASPPPPVNPADADERERLMAQLRAVMRLKRGAVENRNSVVGCAIATYQHVLDGVIADVAVELHRALALGLDTLDSVEQRVPPSASVIAGFEAAAKAQADAAARADGENLAPAHPAPPPAKVGKGTRDIYGRLGGASKEPAECPLCVQRVAAARFAQHLERCMGRGRVAAAAAAGVAAPSRSRGGVASRPRFLPRPAPQRATHAPQPPTGPGLVKVKKTAKTRRISALLGAGAGSGSAEEGDDDDVPLSEMFADAAKVPGRAGAKANKIKLATTGKRDKKTAGTGTGTWTGTGTGTGAKSRRGKKTAAAAPSDPFAGAMMIPFDDVGDFGDFDGFDAADGDDPFDLNFDIELDDGDLPGMAFQTDQFPSSAGVAVAAKPAKKKRTATAPGGRGGRGGRAGSGRGGRGAAPGAATDVSEMVSGTFPASPYDAVAAAAIMTAGAGARGGRGGRGGRGAAAKPRASKAAKDAAGGASNAKASASVPAGAKPRKKPVAAAATKKGKTATTTTTTTAAAAAGAGVRPSDAFDAVFGDPTGGDGFGGGVADEDLELLFDADRDGGTTGGGDARMVDDEFGNLFG